MTPGRDIPIDTQIVERVQELPDVYTWRLRISDPRARETYQFLPGQFNMLSLQPGGEIPISIVSDPRDPHLLGHTIRAVGRVTRAMANLQVGDHVGLRGPFGRGWPLQRARACDVLVLTGGLGCAPAVSAIHYIAARRGDFGRLIVIQGVKHAADLLWREQYDAWARMPDTEVRLAADVGGMHWTGHVGLVTELLDGVDIDQARTVCMMCGPERMMQAAATRLVERGLPMDAVYCSMERNMQCAIGLCGHCQIGPRFTCRDGPVFSWPELQPFFDVAGF